MNSIILKKGKESALLRRHPWVFSGAIERVEGEPEAGSTVKVLDHQGNFLASGAFSPHSSIRVRVWSFDPEEVIDERFISERLRQAIALRSRLKSLSDTNACRLVNAESDGLPGLIVDRFADVLVLQSLTQSSEYWKPTVLAALHDLTGLTSVFERSDDDVRLLEGLPQVSGWLSGTRDETRVKIRENGLDYLVDFAAGHKTGFYLDLRDIRKGLGDYVSGKSVLNCFCYTGSMSMVSRKHGARSVVSVDSSAAALELAAKNAAMNAIEGIEWVEADVFKFLREHRDRANRFDLIILDPPKFAPTASQVEKAARAYKDINLLAFKLLNPGGILVTLSCSGGVSLDLFQKIVADAALDAGRDVKLLRVLRQAEDHPVAISFPEAAYLKGLIVTTAG